MGKCSLGGEYPAQQVLGRWEHRECETSAKSQNRKNRHYSMTARRTGLERGKRTGLFEGHPDTIRRRRRQFFRLCFSIFWVFLGKKYRSATLTIQISLEYESPVPHLRNEQKKSAVPEFLRGEKNFCFRVGATFLSSMEPYPETGIN